MGKRLSGGHFGKIRSFRKVKKGVKLGLVLTAWFFGFVMSILCFYVMDQDNVVQDKTFHVQLTCCYDKMADLATKIPPEIYEQ